MISDRILTVRPASTTANWWRALPEFEPVPRRSGLGVSFSESGPGTAGSPVPAMAPTWSPSGDWSAHGRNSSWRPCLILASTQC